MLLEYVTRFVTDSPIGTSMKFGRGKFPVGIGHCSQRLGYKCTVGSGCTDYKNQQFRVTNTALRVASTPMREPMAFVWGSIVPATRDISLDR